MPPIAASTAIVKRALDILGSSFLIFLSLPLLIGIALAIRLETPGPAFFRQARSGRGFRRFRIFKFRTMVADAPRLGGTLTIRDDPRVTGVGRWLRATKLDELPQLFNVLLGDMSLVGPRPLVTDCVELFHAEYEPLLR